ncbi:MAG: hypothetical protein WC594_00235 [Thermodesulfovibrionales bacterium]
MEEKWYDGLSEDAFLTEEHKKYKKAIEKIKDAVKNGMNFEEACNSVDIEDAEKKTTLIDDALKVLIADMYFMQKMSTDKIAEILKIPIERITSARESMLEEIKETAVKTFRRGVPDN